MEEFLHHCSGCERVRHCEKAFKDEAEGCALYIRSSYHKCHECLRFGEACKSSGLIKCDFLPRKKSSTLLLILDQLTKESRSERKR